MPHADVDPFWFEVKRRSTQVSVWDTSIGKIVIVSFFGVLENEERREEWMRRTRREGIES